MASFFFQADDGIRDWSVTGVQTCALPISSRFGGGPLGIEKAIVGPMNNDQSMRARFRILRQVPGSIFLWRIQPARFQDPLSRQSQSRQTPLAGSSATVIKAFQGAELLSRLRIDRKMCPEFIPWQ